MGDFSIVIKWIIFLFVLVVLIQRLYFHLTNSKEAKKLLEKMKEINGMEELILSSVLLLMVIIILVFVPILNQVFEEMDSDSSSLDTQTKVEENLVSKKSDFQVKTVLSEIDAKTGLMEVSYNYQIYPLENGKYEYIEFLSGENKYGFRVIMTKEHDSKDFISKEKIFAKTLEDGSWVCYVELFGDNFEIIKTDKITPQISLIYEVKSADEPRPDGVPLKTKIIIPTDAEKILQNKSS